MIAFSTVYASCAVFDFTVLVTLDGNAMSLVWPPQRAAERVRESRRRARLLGARIERK
jgi:hypothetical protein